MLEILKFSISIQKFDKGDIKSEEDPWPHLDKHRATSQMFLSSLIQKNKENIRLKSFIKLILKYFFYVLRLCLIRKVQ